MGCIDKVSECHQGDWGTGILHNVLLVRSFLCHSVVSCKQYYSTVIHKQVAVIHNKVHIPESMNLPFCSQTTFEDISEAFVLVFQWYISPGTLNGFDVYQGNPIFIVCKRYL